MLRALIAAAIYFACVFTLGIALGALRVLVFAPRFGETLATAIEIPIMLGAAWFICLRTVRRCRVGPSVASRSVMGSTAFVLLAMGEYALAVFAFNRTSSEYLSALQSTAGLIGFAAQIIFASFPLLQLRLRAR